MSDQAVAQPHITPNLLQGMEAIVRRDFVGAIRILSAEPDTSPGYALCVGNLALAYKNLDLNERAVDCGLRALDEIRRGAPVPPAAAIQFTRTLADALLSLGHPAQALQWCRDTQEFFAGRVWDDPEIGRYVDIEEAKLYGTSYCTALRELGAFADAHEQCLIARRLFQKHGFNDVGVAQCLASQAEVELKVGNTLRAEFALLEARDHADATNDEDQKWRILMRLAGIGSRAVEPEAILEMGNKAADAALSEGRYETASKRLVMTAQILARIDPQTHAIRELFHRANLLNDKLEPTSLLTAESRTIEAEYCDQIGDTEEALRVLLEGASLWLNVLRQQMLAEDVRFRGAKLHDHFRRLTRHLLDRNMTAEAFVAFEVGRGLAHSFVANQEQFERIVTSMPFAPNGLSISTSLLTELQAQLASDQVLLNISLVPPEFVAFVVGKSAVDVVSTHLPENELELMVATQHV